jgi:putative ABC transport system permease protein
VYPEGKSLQTADVDENHSFFEQVGATPRNVQASVFRQGSLTAAVGSAIGLGLALVLIRVLRGVLLGLDSWNAADLWIEVGLVLFTAAFASWLPARRAARVSLSVALRQE